MRHHRLAPQVHLMQAHARLDSLGGKLEIHPIEITNKPLKLKAFLFALP